MTRHTHIIRFFDCFSQSWVEKTVQGKAVILPKTPRTGLSIRSDGRMAFSPPTMEQAQANAQKAFQPNREFRIGDKVQIQIDIAEWGEKAIPWNGIEGTVVGIQPNGWPQSWLEQYGTRTRIEISCIAPSGNHINNGGFLPSNLRLLKV